MPISKSKDVLGGNPHIDGHRIGVHHIVNAIWYSGTSAEKLVEEVYPQLSEHDLIEALEYYQDHRDEIEDIRHRTMTPTSEEITGPEDLPESAL